ncbi:tripartite tricarboxylate transporter substrate-binding protein [Siccirubricoccus deserti]
MVPLTLAARQRSAALPDLPTTAEYGVPRLLAENWYCMVAPPRLPAAIQQKLAAAMRQASQTAPLRAALAEQGRRRPGPARRISPPRCGRNRSSGATSPAAPTSAPSKADRGGLAPLRKNGSGGSAFGHERGPCGA